MKKQILSILLAGAMVMSSLSACAVKKPNEVKNEAAT